MRTEGVVVSVLLHDGRRVLIARREHVVVIARFMGFTSDES